MKYHEEYVSAWNDHEPERVLAQFADGGTYVDPTLDEPLVGREIADYVAEIVSGVPDVHVDERRVVDSEPGVVVSEWTMRGTHSGTLDGLPPTGNAFELDGVDVMTVSAEGITAVRGYFDQETFAEQLGLTFPEIVGQLPRLAVEAIRS